MIGRSLGLGLAFLLALASCASGPAPQQSVDLRIDTGGQAGDTAPMKASITEPAPILISDLLRPAGWGNEPYSVDLPLPELPAPRLPQCISVSMLPASSEYDFSQLEDIDEPVPPFVPEVSEPKISTPNLSESEIGTVPRPSAIPKPTAAVDADSEPSSESGAAAAEGSAAVKAPSAVPASSSSVSSIVTPPSANLDSQENPIASELTAAVGENVTIILDGRGWIYLGAKSQSPVGASGESPVEFMERSFGENNSRFLFLTVAEGDMLLSFQKQEATTGKSLSKRYLVTVTGPKEDTAFQGQGHPASVGNSSEGGGEQDGTLVPSFSIDELTTAYREGRQTEALSHLFELLDAEKEENDPPLGLSRFAILEKPESDAVSVLPASSLLELLDSQVERGGAKEVLDFLLWFVPSVPSAQRDEFYYRIGRLYEETLRPQNPEQAVEYYRKIREAYPWSRYWNDAVKRERYLRRHFLELR
ncbi:tetratricopeptide repeat protein [Sediminispirochaeta bajacaliforniensis]|uniref:tetratricopeptide repeat protein n=1 Tax=Sediminispirochaeta bajacaliforniensis TaxID=148 RepID=UPI00036AA4E7|nr:hypothetical protein [Sediminispirochaeta bajacaliforniensis]